jgi:hypothetical protein
MPELGVYNTYVAGSIPYTFAITSQQGFEIIANQSNTFDNSFYVSDKELDEITVNIRGSNGLAFTNNKGENTFILILSY